MFDEYRLHEEIAKMQQLSGFTPEWDYLPAYIVPTPNPNSMQGGANGDGVTVEVYPESNDLDRAFKLTVHEFAHKALDPSYYFEHVLEGEELDFFKQRNVNVSLNNYYAHMEELIVRSFIDVRQFNADPNKEADNYRGRESSRTDNYAISWEHVNYIYPVVNNYLDGGLDVDATRLELIQEFHQIVDDYQSN